MKEVNAETIFGGIFGLVSIVAAVMEMYFSGYKMTSIAGAVKDISATMVAVMVLLLIFRDFFSKKININFEDRFKNKLDSWAQNNRTIIKKSDIDKQGFYGYDMFTDMNNFYKGANFSKNSGWFVRFPEIKESHYNRNDIKIDFHLNKGTFFEGLLLQPEELEERYEKIASNIRDFIFKLYSNKMSEAFYKNQTITIIMSNKIQTDEEIDSLINILDSMIKAYLVSANIKL